FADRIIGSADTNVIDGWFGADDIDAGAGDDIVTDQDTVADDINLGDDNDTLIVHEASGDTYDGGAGIDTLDLSNESRAYTAGNTIDLSSGTFTAYGTTFSSFENAVGTDQADDIIGTPGNNVLDGGEG